MLQYRTQTDDSLDAICWKFYGKQSGAVEQVLEENPHLAEVGSVLLPGLIIKLPELKQHTEQQAIRLWS